MRIKIKRFLGILLSLALVLSLMPGMSMTAYAEDNSTDYVLTIPATLDVQQAGWNATDGLAAQVKSGDTFSATKKLSVTASSANNWALRSGDNSVGYTLSIESGGSLTTTWEFSADELNTSGGTTKAMGILVEDYSDKPAGIYQDTVTFTASLVDASIPVSGVTINNAPTEELFVNSTGTLTATVSPSNATDNTVTWTSSDPDYVSINETTGEYEVKGTKGYGSATITATAGGKTATCTITGKVHHTSLQAGDIIRVGETIYTGDRWYVDITPATSFQASNGVITLVENATASTLYYKFNRGSNNTKPNWTSFKVTDNTDGIYIVSGTGTSEDKFVFAVHTRPITFTVKRVAKEGYNYADGSYTVAAGTTWQQFVDSGEAPDCLSISGTRVLHDLNSSVMDCGGTFIANAEDKMRVKSSDVIIDGATYGCSDYFGYKDHD